MDTENNAYARRSDLDALRAVAMLLGIVLHASLSFFPSFWSVTDREQNQGLEILFFAIHGFRMPLFFVMSGFFSAMLLYRRGRKALIKHRFFRVFLPLLLGMFTLCRPRPGSRSPRRPPPRSPAVSHRPTGHRTSGRPRMPATWVPSSAHLANGTAVNSLGGKLGTTPLQQAALAGHAEAIELLIRRGADVNAVARDRGTALHAAAFLGHEKAVHALVKNGADFSAANVRGETPLGLATIDEETTRYFASMLKVELDDEGLGNRKAAIAEYLRQRGAAPGEKAGLADLLMQLPVFSHLWFLWFLWWLVLALAAVSALGARLPSIRLPAWLVLSPARYLWLVPLTMIPQWFMGTAGASRIFGPDTSGGLLPVPHVFAYYAIFFGFGAIYFGFDDLSGRVGKRWWLPLSIGLLIVFPMGMALLDGWPSRDGRRARRIAPPDPLRFRAGGLPLAHDIRPHGVVPTGLPGRESDDAIPVGLGLLALPRPSPSHHRGPVRRARLAVASSRQAAAHRRRRDRVPVVDLPDLRCAYTWLALPERAAQSGPPGPKCPRSAREAAPC